MSVATDIGPREAARMLEAGEALALDVREPEEWEAGHIRDALHIELGRLSTEADRIARDRPVLVYCRSGSRSDMAAQALRAAGWDARNVHGGLLAWAQEGLPLEPESGSVA